MLFLLSGKNRKYISLRQVKTKDNVLYCGSFQIREDLYLAGACSQALGHKFLVSLFWTTNIRKASTWMLFIHVFKKKNFE